MKSMVFSLGAAALFFAGSCWGAGWNFAVSGILSLLLYGALLLLTKPRKKIGGVDVELISGGEELEKKLGQAEAELEKLCGEATEIRRRYAAVLCGKIREHLVDLNFLNVEFEMSFEELPEYTAQGKDSAEFLISTNPGEPLRPLMKTASGGELSRIMLAIKTVLADKDEIDTVIFDEIDVGISGRTAQKVSEKMMLIGRTRQVICITHLAQIAAMADSHYRIEKQVEEGETRTQIRRLSEQESIEELARILGGAKITDAVRKNAEEMRALAIARKQSR